MVVLFPWQRLPSWMQIVPPLLYMIVVALLYKEGGGATSGFGTLLMLPILWLALYGTQTQMIVSLVATGVVVAAPQLALGEHRRQLRGRAATRHPDHAGRRP